MKNRLILKTPASWWGAKWREALPSGNGTTGAAVYGAVHDETVLLTHEDLWGFVKTQELPDVSGELSRVRKLLHEGKAEVADKVIADKLTELGYEPNIGAPIPLGDLKIKMPVSQGFKQYRRTLDMETGEVSVSWKDDGVAFERNLFVSRPADLVVMQISSERALEVDIALDLHERSDARWCANGEVALPENFQSLEEGEFLCYAAQNDDGTDFGAVARVVKTENSAIVVVKLFVKEDRSSAWARLKTELAAISMDYDVLLEPHAAEHRELFNRVALDLNATEEAHALSNEELLLEAYQGEAPLALVEKMWSYGRYLLISSSREGGHPCHLLGLWCGEYVGFWAFNMANENLQMIYWQALSGAMPETLVPMFDYYDRMMDDFRENAQKLYGCRGICIPAVSTPPSGLLKTVYPHIIHWTGAAAWIGQHYYDYYLHTGDETFLKERVLPFLRETALFYEDFFSIGDDGFFVSAPSNSPENNPAEYWDGTGMGEAAMETTINATMDFALAKEVLTHLIEGSQVLGETEGVEKWQGMLEKIPAYQINDDGAVREWMHPFFSDNYHHRHQSHIYPVFPGTEVTRENDAELYKAFEVALRKRLAVGIGEQTGWSLAHMSNIYARMNDGDRALECLDLLARSCVKNNFYTVHNDWRGMGIGLEMEWAPFQIDANMGWSAAVQEMLLFSVPGKLNALPALPTVWKKGAVKGLVARGGIQVSMDWNENEICIDLFSATGQVVELSVMGNRVDTLTLSANTHHESRITR
ncbi:glycoside hydrolase N-terminal domain-containing protein [Pontiellaceae bacterium B12227]|nr:glycoside hydrolase N-terminal domain-containing protein [Pontiellaceae bacterium B12227]